VLILDFIQSKGILEKRNHVIIVCAAGKGHLAGKNERKVCKAHRWEPNMKFTADEKYVKIMGRTLWYDNTRYLNYSCAAIEFTFTGTYAEAVLWTDSGNYEDKLKAWVAVFVDDEEIPSKRFPLLQEEETYVLYKGSEVKETRIRLVKYSEVAFGRVGIKEIITDSEVLPTPGNASERKLEFIGDSITCGYGNEGIWNTDIFHTEQENPWEAYAALTARSLQADYHLISWSGIGIISNWTDQEEPNADWLMPDMYPYTDKAADLAFKKQAPEVWDHKKYTPHCIIINLGTNDSSYTKGVAERIGDFGREYYRFVKAVRGLNPGARILCTLGAMGQELYPEVERQVELLRREGDKDIYSMAFEVQKEEDGIGSDWHPSKVTHKKMADKLTNEIRKIMNWQQAM